MKAYKVGLFFSAIIAFAMSPAGADGVEAVYLGLHAGKPLLSDSAKVDFNEDVYTGGIFAGAEVMHFAKSSVAVEVDGSLSLGKGTSDVFDSWKLSTLGLYGCMRVGDKAVYLKLRLGIVYENIGVEPASENSSDDLGFSPGLGAGARLGERVFIEIDGTIIDQSISVLRAAVGVEL